MLRIKRKFFFDYLLLFIFLRPPIFSIVSDFVLVERICSVAELIAVVLLGISLVMSKERFSASTVIIIPITLIWGFQLIPTLLYSGNISNTVLTYLKLCFASAWFGGRLKTDAISITRRIAIYLSIVAGLNLLLTIVYPNGAFMVKTWRAVDSYWLFGNKNSTPAMVLPAVIFSILAYLDSKKKIYILLAIISSMAIVACGSATALIGLLVFGGIIIVRIGHKNKGIVKSYFFNINTYVVIVIIAIILVVVMNNLSFLSYFIVEVFGKDLTLSNRTDIWSRFIKAIIKKPLLGYGCQYTATVRELFNTSHQHNYYLHLLYQGGMAVAISFCAFINQARKELIKNRSMDSYILSAGVFSFLIMFITEVYGEQMYILPFYMILVYAMNLSVIKEGELV